MRKSNNQARLIVRNGAKVNAVVMKGVFDAETYWFGIITTLVLATLCRGCRKGCEQKTHRAVSDKMALSQ